MKRKYKLLDLFCGVGGCSMGYYNAGFEVEGVDIKNQVNYPFKFYQSDALQFEIDLNKYDVIHASPPCQAYSFATVFARRCGKKYPDLVKLTRERLKRTNKIYIIENVPGSPLIQPVQICASYFNLFNNDLFLVRHRWFESNVKLFGTPCQHSKFRKNISIVGDSDSLLSFQRKSINRKVLLKEKSNLMNMRWIKNNYELSQAIPPCYTEFLGKQIIAILDGKSLKSLIERFKELYQ